MESHLEDPVTRASSWRQSIDMESPFGGFGPLSAPGVLVLAAALSGCSPGTGASPSPGATGAGAGGVPGGPIAGGGVGASAGLGAGAAPGATPIAPGTLNLEGSPKYYSFVRLTNAQWARAVQDVLHLEAPSGL